MDKKIATTPKLLNGFGEVFDYKNTELENQAIEQIHQKKLNLERDINRFKVQKKTEKNNFYKFKNTAKTILKSSKAEINFKYKSERKSLLETIKYHQNLINFENFISKQISVLNKQIKVHVKKSIKSLKLIQYSDETDEELELKTKNYKNQALEIENKMLIYKNFLETILLKENFNNAEIKSEQIEHIYQTYLNQDDVQFSDYIKLEFKKLIKSYKSQPYFKYHKETLLLTRRLEVLKDEYKKNKAEIKNTYKQSLETEKQRIKNKYQANLEEAKATFLEQRLQIRSQEVSDEAKMLDQEIKTRLQDRKKTIKEIKKAEKQSYQQNVKTYKQNNKSHFKFWSNKNEAINNAKNTFNLRLAFDYKLASLNRWETKYHLNQIKANYLENLGNKLNNLSYDGDFYLKNSQALNEYIEAKHANDSDFIHKVEANQKLIDPATKMNAEDQAKFNEEQKILVDKFNQQMQTLKEQLKQKAITKEAYKLSKMKAEIFLQEDLKALKMNLSSSKEKYDSKDALITYQKENQLIKKNWLQNQNKIAKEIPIEYKRNNSIWMTLIAFFLPGVDSLILKNWKKAIFFLVMTVLTWAIFVPYAFGVYNIQGQGIIGLIKLSWPTGLDSPVYGPLWSDSRYALVEGVIGLLLLTLCISYLTISAYQCFKITRAMEKGIRSKTWVETKKTLRSSGFPFAISIPGLIMIVFIVIMPIIVSFLLAFTNIGTQHNPAGGDETSWVGFEQFIRLFTNKEFFKPFGNVLLWNIIWAVSTTALVLVLGTVMALAIENKNIKGKVFWRTIFILPWAIPAFLSILFFKIIFGDSDSSLINSLLIQSGMKAIKWQTDPIMSRLILILIQGWLGHSYIVLLVSGNMKAIPNDIYEAGRIDGAKPFKQFMKMTLPIILLQIAPLLISQFTFNFNNFSIIWLFNDGGAKIDPTYIYDVGNNDIILSWIFKITFGAQGPNIVSNQALGSALVILMSIFIVGASGIGFARSKAFRKGEDI